MLRLGKGQLQVLGQLAGEVVTADRHTSLPNPEAIGHDQIAGVRSDRQEHARRRWIVRIEDF